MNYVIVTPEVQPDTYLVYYMLPRKNTLRLRPLLSFSSVTPVSDVQAIGGDAHHECQQGDGPGHYLRHIH